MLSGWNVFFFTLISATSGMCLVDTVPVEQRGLAGGYMNQRKEKGYLGAQECRGGCGEHLFV